jgi:uncharacterized protein
MGALVNSLYIAATEGGSGKTTLAVGLCLALRGRGINAGYFKPVGVADATAPTDDDVIFVADVLGLQEPLEDLCPLVLNDDVLRVTAEGSSGDSMERLAQAFSRVAAGHDVVVSEGLGEIWQGRFLRLSGADVVSRLDQQALLVARFSGIRQLDDVCYVKDVLKKRLLGAVFTMVPETRREVVEQDYAPFLARSQITMYGALPADSRLMALRVGTIAAGLNGRFLAGEEHADALAETYLIGAMSAEHALAYFERTPDKVVVVGGDREDLILTALKTPTVALVLTGSYLPSAEVLEKARRAGVAAISVSGDTVAAADGLRRMFGRLRVHEHPKIDRIRELVDEHIDVDGLLAALA